MKSYETPTSISAYEYCQRLGALNKLYPFGGSKSVATVIGTVEHAVFEEYYRFFRLDSLKHGRKIFKNEKYHKARIEKVLEYIEEEYAKNRYYTFFQHIKDELPSLSFRLDLHHHQKLQEIKELINSSNLKGSCFGNNKFEEAISIALPFETEKKLSSYDIFGRVDCLYNALDGSIIPEDLKSHSSRFDSLIHQNEHKMQLCAYAILIESEYKKPVHSARIFYTKDLTYENFNITKADKKHVLKNKDKLQSLLNEGLPPVIDNKLKCNHCYKQKLCQTTTDSILDGPTEYIPLEGDQE